MESIKWVAFMALIAMVENSKEYEAVEREISQFEKVFSVEKTKENFVHVWLESSAKESETEMVIGRMIRFGYEPRAIDTSEESPYHLSFTKDSEPAIGSFMDN